MASQALTALDSSAISETPRSISPGHVNKPTSPIESDESCFILFQWEEEEERLSCKRSKSRSAGIKLKIGEL